MGQSLVKNYIHLIYSTKHCVALIHEPVAGKLYTYLGGICRNLECNPVKIGGHTDHVHILCMLSKKISVKMMLLCTDG